VGMKIGLIGIVRQELRDDPWGTMEAVAGIGYQGMESIGGIARHLGLEMPELKRKLAELGLDPIAQGGGFLEGDDEKLERAIAGAQAVDCKYVVSYWGPCESRDQVLALAAVLDRFGARCREAGLTFCYHNHNHEFAAFDGEYGLDILAANTAPENVKLELDIAWVTYGGADPAAMIRRHAGRCPILHVKDFATVPEGGATGNDERKGHAFTEVGTGVVDLAGAVAAARECGVEWLIVEQDEMRDLSPMESIRVSYENLKRAVG
jgi:sugar phosphate isomerase/epimerase